MPDLKKFLPTRPAPPRAAKDPTKFADIAEEIKTKGHWTLKPVKTVKIDDEIKNNPEKANRLLSLEGLDNTKKEDEKYGSIDSLVDEFYDYSAVDKLGKESPKPQVASENPSKNNTKEGYSEQDLELVKKLEAALYKKSATSQAKNSATSGPCLYDEAPVEEADDKYNALKNLGDKPAYDDAASTESEASPRQTISFEIKPKTDEKLPDFTWKPEKPVYDATPATAGALYDEAPAEVNYNDPPAETYSYTQSFNTNNTSGFPQASQQNPGLGDDFMNYTDKPQSSGTPRLGFADAMAASFKPQESAAEEAERRARLDALYNQGSYQPYSASAGNSGPNPNMANNMANDFAAAFRPQINETEQEAADRRARLDALYNGQGFTSAYGNQQPSQPQGVNNDFANSFAQAFTHETDEDRERKARLNALYNQDAQQQHVIQKNFDPHLANYTQNGLTYEAHSNIPNTQTGDDYWGEGLTFEIWCWNLNFDIFR